MSDQEHTGTHQEGQDLETLAEAFGDTPVASLAESLEETMERLMERHGDGLMRLCFMMLSDHALAEDAVSETFFKAFRAYPRFRHDSSEYTWLTRIAINTCHSLRARAWFRFESKREDMDRLKEEGEEYLAPVLFDNEWMIYLRLMDGDGRDSYDYFPFLLSGEEGQQGALPLTVSCVFVNAKSKNIGKAIQFLEVLSHTLQPDARIMMREKDNSPLENPYYEQTLKDYRDLLARKRTEMDQAKELEKAALAAWLKRAEGFYEEMKESQRWQISPGQIAAYRKLAEHAFVKVYDNNAQGAQAAFDILPQYVDGSISLDQYITEIQNRLRLIQQEGR